MAYEYGLGAAALDYLTGFAMAPEALPNRRRWPPFVPVVARWLVSVRGVGVLPETRTDPVPAVQSMLVGLAAGVQPFVLRVIGSPQDTEFSLGTWSTAQTGANAHTDHLVARGLIEGLYPDVTTTTATLALSRDLTVGGLVHGLPAAPRTEPGRTVEASGWDKLLRSMRDCRYAVLVLAEPIDPESLLRLRQSALEDLRAAGTSQGSEVTPLLKAYHAQAEVLLDLLNRALATGGWRVGVYLLGDEQSYWRLAAAWAATFSGAEPTSTPLRIVRTPEVPELAHGWLLPYQPAAPGPGSWRYPFANQTLIDTARLATLADLPRREWPGFSVRPAPTFALAHPDPPPSSSVLDLGKVIAHERPTSSRYRMDVNELTRHGFVAGLTGAGKTNTVIHLLLECAQRGLPFLVIEPAKTEYRTLLLHPALRDRLRIFTVGKEHVSPLRLNPFDPPPGTSVVEHVDLLKALFAASFAMWVPLPQILEQALIQLYTERGWNFATGANDRVRPGEPAPVPTLSDLTAVVETIVPALGYKAESTQEITASLTTRLQALGRGSRGLMLDVERSLPIAELLSGPTVVELEGLADDDDKAFVMGLILTELYEHRRARHRDVRDRPCPGTLAHLVVVEEAHRLLSRAESAGDSYHADPAGAFVELFGQMLAEVRSYGQAMLVVDQVPVRLAPDVLKNTNLKICHRLVARDDRTAMAGAMAMTEEQAAHLSLLQQGRTAIFSEGDRVPVLVDVPPTAKNLNESGSVGDADVAAHMARWSRRPEIVATYGGHPHYATSCDDAERCQRARRLAASADGRLLGTRLVAALAEDGEALETLWPDVAAFIGAQQRTGLADAGLEIRAGAVHVFLRAVGRRAHQGQWSVADTDAIVAAGVPVLVARAADPAPTTHPQLTALLQRLQVREREPYPLCAQICSDGRCAYRDPLRDVFETVHHRQLWSTAPDPATYDQDVAARCTAAASDLFGGAADGTADGRPFTIARGKAVACAVQTRTVNPARVSESLPATVRVLAGLGWELDPPPRRR